MHLILFGYGNIFGMHRICMFGSIVFLIFGCPEFFIVEFHINNILISKALDLCGIDFTKSYVNLLSYSPTENCFTLI